MEVILTHNHADFDAIASQLAAHRLFPDAVPVLPVRLSRDVSEFLMLYRSGLPFINWHDARIRSLRRIILTDTTTVPSVRGAQHDTPILIIDHHPPDRAPAAHETWWVEPLGAVTTLLVEEIQRRQLTLSLLEATLLALGIYADTGLLTYARTTPRDVRAAAWLLEQGAELDTLRKFLSSPLTDAQQQLYITLSQQAETRTLHGYAITVCHASTDQVVDGVNIITRRIAETLEPTAIVTLVQMPRIVQLVARSSDDAVNVGELAASLGGGGHARAAAAAIEAMPLDSARARVWAYLEQTVRPAVTIRELMSRGVQTVAADDAVRAVAPRLRRIGHEGYPVVEGGRVVGLLTRRDADRALEHGLHDAIVRDVMQAGSHVLTPEDSVGTLESLMLESGWGQIPVVENDQLLGIVTRTDLLRHWVRAHPRPHTAAEVPAPGNLLERHPAPVSALIRLIARHAAAVSAYLVGGFVRDALLHYPNHDIDIVIEQDAIAFVASLVAAFGGQSSSVPPFGTAKWLLDETAAAHVGVALKQLPPIVDFATARYETYAYPTALPSVYTSSITLDLRRRDFTINAMALQISPEKSAGTLVDTFGGRHDLEAGLVRVLHSLSFVDDPTRILRAVRFATRYNFRIEERSLELLLNARPMLARITGERLRNELNLLLAEKNTLSGLRHLHRLGVDVAMHPHFVCDDAAMAALERLQHRALDEDRVALAWHVLLGRAPVQQVAALAERFLLPGTLSHHIQATAQAWHSAALHDPAARPSQIARVLANCHASSLEALELLAVNAPARDHLTQYRTRWRDVRPATTGHTLRALGVPPGRVYRRVLDALRDARLDGQIQSDQEEAALLNSLLQEANRDTRGQP